MTEEPGPRMSDVARRAGVSQMTVSRVLNEPSRVRADTRQRVEAAIRELGYRRNAIARNLVTRRSQTIGVAALSTTLFGPSSTLHGIEEAARDAGYFVSVCAVRHLSADGIREAVGRLVDQPVDGVVVIAPFQFAVDVLVELQPGVPFVVAEGPADAGLPGVAVDQHLGARLAVEHLLELGHERVHHVAGPPDWLEATARVSGWRDALTAAGRQAPEPLVGDWTARSGYQAGLRLAGAGDVTAVFAANDPMALGVLRAFREQGIAVPDDVSVVGYDDVPESAYYSPPLTTVRQDFAEVGRRSIERLLARLSTAPLRDGLQLIPPQLVVRSSTAPPPPRPSRRHSAPHA